MNKIVLTLVVVAVIVVTLGTAGLAYAQSPVPTTPVPGTGFGAGRMGGGGMRGSRGAGSTVAGEGILHDYMIAAFAQKLGIPVVDLEARIDKGETMAQISASKNMTIDQFRTLMTEARSQAIDQAVNDGKLTQAQADWMKQRGFGQMGAGRGMRGGGLGQFANPGCPYYAQPAL